MPVHAISVYGTIPPLGHITAVMVMQSSAVRATTGFEHFDRTRTALVVGCSRPPQNLSIVGRHAGMDVSVVVFVDAFVHMVFALLVADGVSGTGASGGCGGKADIHAQSGRESQPRNASGVIFESGLVYFGTRS